MKSRAAIFDDRGSAVRLKITGLYAVLVASNLVSWAWAYAAFYDRPLLLGTALIAYGLGLRHAVDADHIAAIDNVTRKLMQDGKRPIAVGFFFALGHSTVVILGSGLIAVTASTLQDRYPGLIEAGGVVGGLVSVFFLFLIATVNIIVAVGVFRLFLRVKHGEKHNDDELNSALAPRGVLAQLCRSLFRLISRSWRMYPLGFLFGLGFDTATEIGLLGISAAEVSKGSSAWSILVFPALFTAGMTLIDTSDGVLMLGAYGWAFMNPIRKLFYNLTITLISVVVALVIGGIEALSLTAEKFNLQGGIWNIVHTASGSFAALGYVVVGIFVASWLVSLLIYRLMSYEGSA